MSTFIGGSYKKTIAILLSLLMALSLAACGSQVPTGESGANDQTETTAPDTVQTDSAGETAEPTETEPATEPETQAPAFDASWAGNEFEQQIAEPKFEDWEVNEYIEGSSWSIYVPEIFYEDVKAYVDDLRSYGFDLNEDENDSFNGLGYVFAADNESGYHISLHFEAHYVDTLKGRLSLKITK